MQNKDLEQGLRDRIYDHEMPVDTEQLWLNVQADLHPPKKRRGLIWWWLPGLLLIGSLGWFAFSLLEEDSAQTQDANRVEEQAEVPKASALTVPAEAEGTTDSGSTIDETKMAVPPVNTGNTDLVKSSQGEVANLSSSSRLATKAPPFPAPIVSTPAPATPPKNTVDARHEVVLASSAPVTSSTNDLAEVRQQIMATAQITTLPIDLLPKRYYDPTTPPFSELKDPACPVFTKRRRAQWSIGAVGILSKPEREITALTTEGGGQRARNLKVERPLNAITGQILAGYETGSGFSLRSGLGYTRTNSVAEVTLDTTITTIGTGITEVIINGPGDTTFITGVVERRIHTTGTTRFYNRLSTIDVPILLGKTFRAGKWRFGVEAGPVLNLLTSGSARYQLADGTFSTRADNENLFRKRLSGIGWQGSLSANFQVLPKLDIGLGFNAYRQPTGGFEVAGSPTSTTYTNFGVRMGVKRYF